MLTNDATTRAYVLEKWVNQLLAPKTTIVSVSGGLSSAYALKLALEQETKVTAVFADVKGTGYSHFWSDLPEIDYLLHERFGGESKGAYRTLWQVSNALNIPIERLEDGRSIWAVAGQSRMFRLFAGSTAFCKASEVLKRSIIASWIECNYPAGTYRIALGMGVLEPHRIKSAQAWWSTRLGWNVEVYSPIIRHYQQTGQAIDNCHIIDWANENGIEISDAYLNNMPHDNCNKFCFMAGQTQYANAYRIDPMGYKYAAWQEMRLNAAGRLDATILGIERNGVKRPITLTKFIELIESGDVNMKDMGHGCSCVAYPTQQPLFTLPEIS